MLGRKKLSGDEALAVALLKGITEASDEQARKEAYVQREKGDLQKAYNAASGVLKGLSGLRNLPDSTFAFTENPSEKAGVFSISTNISAKTDPKAIEKGIGQETVSLSIEPNGRIRINGDTFRELVSVGPVVEYFYKIEHFSSKRRSATEEALTYIAKKAKEKCLVP